MLCCAGALLHSLMDQCVYLGQLLGRAGLDCRHVRSDPLGIVEGTCL
jgi:hypothetical protein